MYKSKQKDSFDYSKKLVELEQNQWVIMYKKNQDMPKDKYHTLISDWDSYYKMVREESPMYKLYKESYKALFVDRNINIVKKNAVIAREWLLSGKRMTTPSYEDPRVIEAKQEVQTYKRLMSMYRQKDNGFSDI